MSTVFFRNTTGASRPFLDVDFVRKFRILSQDKFRLKDFDPSDTHGFEKEDALARIEKNVERLFELQYLLYADNRQSLLIILQGMDSSGKDGVIRHVMRGLNPQGCTVASFKAPTTEESEHDFLWRIHKMTPAKGDITIFNRSHYEDVLVPRVHHLVPKKAWKARYDQINDFEWMLSENGTRILKFFLYISKDEQKERLEERLQKPEKNWKFNTNDLKERERWGEYMDAYEDLISRCSKKWAPWYVIPADKKWFRNLAISKIVNDELQRMKLKMPPPLPGASQIRIK